MNFRTLILATTSLVALGAAAAPASAGGMMGDVSLGYAYNWQSFEEGGESLDTEYPALFGSGRVNLPYSNTVNVQLDVVGRASMSESLFSSGGESTEAVLNDNTHIVLGGHVNYRDAQGMLGVFVGAGRMSDIPVIGGSAPIYMAGIEGQYYCDQWTFGGQLGYMDSDESLNLLANAGFVKGDVAFYASQKLKLAASLAYINGETFFGLFDAEEWGWSAGVHYWFGKSIPVSGFIEYRGRNSELSDGGESYERDEHTVDLGLTFHFGGDGFKDADRNGASANLPDPNWYRLYPVSF
jgi:hypothetical protein